MQNFTHFIKQVRAAAVREEGQGTVEYVLVTGVIVVALVGVALTGLDSALDGAITAATSAITGAF